MTDTSKRLLKHYAIPVGILLAFFGVFYGLSYLSGIARKKYLTAAAESLCHSYSGFKGRRIAFTERTETAPSGLFCRAALPASIDDRKAVVFFLPLNSKYGVYPAVFFYEQSMGCIFCGLAGVNISPEQIETYGITKTTVAFHRNKIETLMKNQTR